MYQLIIHEINNVIRNKNNMIESLEHNVKEKALMKYNQEKISIQ